MLQTPSLSKMYDKRPHFCHESLDPLFAEPPQHHLSLWGLKSSQSLCHAAVSQSVHLNSSNQLFTPIVHLSVLSNPMPLGQSFVPDLPRLEGFCSVTNRRPEMGGAGDQRWASVPRAHRNSVQNFLETTSPHMWSPQEKSDVCYLESHGIQLGTALMACRVRTGQEWAATFLSITS